LSGSTTDEIRGEGYEWATTRTATGHDDRSDRHAPRLLLRAPVELAEHSPNRGLPMRIALRRGFRTTSRQSNWHPKSAESSALWIESPPMPWPDTWSPRVT
jgi:hypothetical protein